MLPVFTQAILAHCNNGGGKLYNPDLMRPFAESHAPGLYDLLLRSITRNDERVSDKHKDLQEQRVVALLHILSYFRYLIRDIDDVTTEQDNPTIMCRKFELSCNLFERTNRPYLAQGEGVK